MNVTNITAIIQTAIAFGALVVGLVTLRLVLVTLQEQINLNKAQYDLLKIESNRAAREIRPTFYAMHLQSTKSTAEFAIKCKNAMALEVTIYASTKYFYHAGLVNWEKTVNEFPQISHGETLRSYFLNTGSNEKTVIDLFVVYTDEDGRAYHQPITLINSLAVHGKLKMTDGKVVYQDWL